MCRSWLGSTARKRTKAWTTCLSACTAPFSGDPSRYVLCLGPDNDPLSHADGQCPKPNRLPTRVSAPMPCQCWRRRSHCRTAHMGGRMLTSMLMRTRPSFPLMLTSPLPCPPAAVALSWFRNADIMPCRLLTRQLDVLEDCLEDSSTRVRAVGAACLEMRCFTMTDVFHVYACCVCSCQGRVSHSVSILGVDPRRDSGHVAQEDHEGPRKVLHASMHACT